MPAIKLHHRPTHGFGRTALGHLRAKLLEAFINWDEAERLDQSDYRTKRTTELYRIAWVEAFAAVDEEKIRLKDHVRKVTAKRQEREEKKVDVKVLRVTSDDPVVLSMAQQAASEGSV